MLRFMASVLITLQLIAALHYTAYYFRYWDDRKKNLPLLPGPRALITIWVQSEGNIGSLLLQNQQRPRQKWPVTELVVGSDGITAKLLV